MRPVSRNSRNKIEVMRYPLSVKKTSTPIHPPGEKNRMV